MITKRKILLYKGIEKYSLQVDWKPDWKLYKKKEKEEYL